MIQKPFIIPQPLQPIGKPVTAPNKVVNRSSSFNNVLQKELQQESVKFSKHAQERLDARFITLSKQHLQRLQEAVDKAQAKGCKESLIILDNLAFVVSIKNKTVITAVDGENRKENIFTNIDSAVIN